MLVIDRSRLCRSLWHTLQKYRGAYTARALMTLVSEAPTPMPGQEEPRVVCLVDKLMEPLVRLQWEQLLETLDASEKEASIVHSLPFVPRPIDRMAGKKMKSKSRHRAQMD
jgi:hypothetical protein